eukprot:Gb_13365 [translate_table: standard]
MATNKRCPATAVMCPQMALSNENFLMLDSNPSISSSMDLGSLNPSLSSNITSNFTEFLQRGYGFECSYSSLVISERAQDYEAVCQSKKSWQARHIGIKIVQWIAILMDCVVLPHLRSLVEIIEYGLNDENQKV